MGRVAIAGLLLGLVGCSAADTSAPGAEFGDAAVGALSATGLPAGFVDETVATGVAVPTAMQFAPDGRLFIAGQGGAIRIIKNGTLLSAPFLTLSVVAEGERGLLGVAFDPNFATNNYVYVYYTTASPAVHNRVSRFTANGDVVLAGSEKILLELNNLNAATNHNGGALNMGPDGKLYIAVGENAVPSNAQTLGNLLGKILRMNLDGSIPTDNPFYGSATGNNRLIWALGLRNPFTFAFKPGSARMFINDVGQDTWEEVNDGIAGSNYGWPTTEGATSNAAFRSPFFAYNHSYGCAITGGAFYAPATTQFPAAYKDVYFFADYCGGWIATLNANTKAVVGFAGNIPAPVDLKVSTDGSLWYVARGDESVHRIRYQPTTVATLTTEPSDLTVSVGQAATFTCAATGTAPIAWAWQRNGVNIAGATAATYTLPSAAAVDTGATFRCIASNAAGTDTSRSAVLTVVSNRPPTGTIVTPTAGTTYRAGTKLTFSGTGTDPEDGTLPASAFTWRIDFHHDTHNHPALPATTGIKGGSFAIPTVGETSANVWFRMHLIVKDSAGLAQESTVDVHPVTSNITLATSPAGLQVTLDGRPMVTPVTVTSVVGIERSLGVVSPQTAGGTSYAFVRWSDNGAATHTISTPAANTTYTATYQAATASNGLKAEYYDTYTSATPELTRTDANIDFDWGAGAPASGFGVDQFAVRWTGRIRPAYSETYTIYTQANDGVRVWLNGQLIINDWVAHPLTEKSTTVTLQANQLYDLKVEYFEDVNLAVARLLWSSPSQPKQVVPTNRLFLP